MISKSDTRSMGRSVALLTGWALVATTPAPGQQQADAILESLIGEWSFVIRGTGPAATYSSTGVRTFSRADPAALVWVDVLDTGIAQRGGLRFDSGRSLFVYSFRSSNGIPCTVEGRLVSAQAVHFTRAGTCSGMVMESDLVLLGRDHHTYSRSDGGFVGEYRRVDP